MNITFAILTPIKWLPKIYRERHGTARAFHWLWFYLLIEDV